MPSQVARLFELLMFGSDTEPRPRSRDDSWFEQTSEQISPVSTVDPVTPVTTTSDATKKETVQVRHRESRSSVSVLKNWQRSWIEASRDPVWRPHVLQLRPISGLTALIFVICSIFASLAILVASDGQPIESWQIQPTVYLAIVVSSISPVGSRYSSRTDV